MLKNDKIIKAGAPQKCSSCRLSSRPVFTSLRESELQQIEKIKKDLFLKKGAIIFSEHGPNSGIYVIRSGLIKVYKSCWERGQDFIFAFAKPGDVVDLAAHRDEDSNVSTETLSVSESQVCCFESKLFFAFLPRFPTLALELLSRVCRELNTTRYKAINAAYYPVAARFADFLLYLKDADLGVYLSRGEMAQAVGCSLETAIRLISQFRKKGIIKIKSKELRIVNSNALLKMTRGRANARWL